MANTTFKGPVRSQNGFLEWNGTAWVPVQGGGGGGGELIVLADEYASSFGYADNRYSDNYFNNPPSGPTAGNIIQLPVIEVGQSYTIRGYGASGGNSGWAIQLPPIPGTDLSAFFAAFFGANYLTTGVNNFDIGVYTYTPVFSYYSDGTLSSPTDTMYIYGSPLISGPLEIIRLPNLIAPGFGTVAVFNQSAIPTFKNETPFPDPWSYPYLQLLPPSP